MAKGRVQRLSFRIFRDEETGTRVVRLTPPGVNAFRNYFYQKAFTSDGARLLLGASGGDLESGDGTVQLWLVGLDGEARQLTDGAPAAVQGAYLSDDDRFVYFSRSNRFHVRLDLATLAEEVVYDAPDGWSLYGTWSPNTGTTRVAGLLMRNEDRVGGQGWDRFARQFEARPRQRLVDLDLATGACQTVLEENRFLGRPAYRPGPRPLISYCHEGPHDRVDARIWLVGADGSSPRPLRTHRAGESLTHEFWVPDGTRMVYVSILRGQSDRQIWSGDPDTLENRLVMTMPPCTHLMSNHDGRLLVGDGVGQFGDLADAEGHRVAPDNHLYLFDTAAGSTTPVAVHGSSWSVFQGSTQANHPHPSFHPDEQRVLFASDRDGAPALYLAELP
jgi:oligogalacturonide lyase